MKDLNWWMVVYAFAWSVLVSGLVVLLATPGMFRKTKLLIWAVLWLVMFTVSLAAGTKEDWFAKEKTNSKARGEK